MSATVTIEVTAVAPPVDNALAVAATTENEADQQQPQNDEVCIPCHRCYWYTA
jgi:hypothetical protein